MNNFDQFMKGTFKKIVPWVALAFGIMLTIAGSVGISAAKNQHFYSDSKALYIVLLIFYWLIAACAIACVVLYLVHKFSANKPQTNYSQGMYQQPNNYQTNSYQPNNAAVNQNVNPNNGFNAAPNAAGERFCTNCGAKIPEGSAFCSNCGSKG